MANRGLGPGTRSVYMNYIRKKFSGAAYEAAYAAGVCAADHEAEHAPDLPDDLLWKFVEQAPPEWQPVIYLMYVCGFRIKAIRYFRRRRIFLPSWKKWLERDLEIVVAIDKNRRLKAHRTTLILPRAWKYPRPPNIDTWRFLQEGPQEECLFSEVTATKVNAVLRKIALDNGWQRPTTYSFRRGYINRIIPLVESKGKVHKYSLHFDETTVDAFYRRTAKERQAME